MRLLLINADRALFEEESAARRRLSLFKGGEVKSIDIITFSVKKHSLKEPQEISDNVHVYPTNSFLRLLYGFDALGIAKKLARPDAVSAQDPFETGLAAFFIAHYWNVPLVVEMHTDFLSPSFVRHSILNRFRVLIAGFVLRRAAVSYAVSERIKKSVEKQYKLSAPVEILPIYIDLARFRSIVRAPQKGNLLWIGRFESEKDPILALEAFAALRNKDVDARLTMLGTGRLESQLKSLSARLGVAGTVTFPGWQDTTQYLSRAELLLVTSEYEGYGMALVEALAAGLPVLSTDVGVAREAGAIIAESSYEKALSEWFAHPQQNGVLKLESYSSEEEYFAKLRFLYTSVAKK